MKYNLVNTNYEKDYVDNLLTTRGIDNLTEYKYPELEQCAIPPLALKNIQLGAVLYQRVVKNNGRILIIVDSDNDGYTSAAIIYQYTKRLNPNCIVDYWLHEGKQHGLQDHIKKLLNQDIRYDLIILPDSSSNDIHYHDQLDGINTPCLVLDHHLTDTNLSDNAVVVNNQLSPNYPNKELTGAGVVWQFCRYLDSLNGTDWAMDYTDLAAWGIIGDMGSVLELENRAIINYGLHHIKNDLFKALIQKQAYSITGVMSPSDTELDRKLTPISVAFYIVPLINAVIRIGTMEEKEMLFQAFVDGARLIPSGKRGAKGELERLDVEIARIATNAKNRQKKMKEDAVARVESKIAKYDLLQNKVLFIRLEDNDVFPPELNGLIAMQLSQKYQRPTIVARLNKEGVDKGSARGLSQSELKDFKAFLLQSGCFEYAQGHANAFGVAIPDNKLREFHEWANHELESMDLGEQIYDINFVRESGDTDIADIIMDIGKYANLWGQGNPEPLMVVKHVCVTNTTARIMGANQDTVKIENGGVAYMQFHAKDLINALKGRSETYLTVVGRANVNEWNSKIIPQLFIDDYEIEEINI